MTRPGSRPAGPSCADPGRGTLREAIDDLYMALQEAARHEVAAREAHASAPIDSTEEKIARGWLLQSVAEKRHWREYLTAYRTHLDAHPELADKPLGTRCTHGRTCLIGRPIVGPGGGPMRDVGCDDGDAAPDLTDPRLPPERDQADLPF